MKETVKKKSRGRPTTLSAKKRLPEVRVTEEQLSTYKEAAERESKTFSAWVRAVLDRASK